MEINQIDVRKRKRLDTGLPTSYGWLPSTYLAELQMPSPSGSPWARSPPPLLLVWFPVAVALPPV